MKRIVAIILVAAAVLLTAQTPKVLTNQDVLDMVNAKLSDSVILAAIHTSTCKFSTEPQDLIALHKAGVSDAVIQAMTEAGAPAPGAVQRPILPSGIAGAAPSGATPSPGSQAAGDPNDPMAPHDSGIYLYTKDRGGKPEMIVLERVGTGDQNRQRLRHSDDLRHKKDEDQSRDSRTPRGHSGERGVAGVLLLFR